MTTKKLCAANNMTNKCIRSVAVRALIYLYEIELYSGSECAGYYIESWGRGIQEIRDACKNLGSKEPEYIVHGEDIMVKLSAFQRAKTPNRQNGGLDGGLEIAMHLQVIEKNKRNPHITRKTCFLRPIFR